MTLEGIHFGRWCLLPRTRTLVRGVARHRTPVAVGAVTAAAVLVGLSAVLAVQSSANARLSDSLARETRAKNDLAAANSA